MRYRFIHSYVKRAHRSYKLKDQQASSMIDHTTPVQSKAHTEWVQNQCWKTPCKERQSP